MVMKTKEYIEKFNLNKSVDFDRSGFIKQLGKEFLDSVDLTRRSREDFGYTFEFNAFQGIVKNIERKFWSISNKRKGPALTPELFGSFYAIYVIPTREKLFPVEHEQITKRWKKLNTNIAEIEA